jgi:uncharacterized membrane protein
MTKVQKQGPQKPGKGTPHEAGTKQPAVSATPGPSSLEKRKGTPHETGTKQPAVSATPGPSSPEKGKQTGKGNKARVGGTAVPGAKSTAPRQVEANTPTQQQYESYNREMRRRMQHLGTGPSGENTSVADQQRKRLERRKKKIEERKQEVKKVAASGPTRITLGRRNTYFLIGAVVVLLLLILLFIIIRHPFS